MDKREKEKVRISPEWPEIARYYDKYHDVIQHNVAVHSWRQKCGLEPRGMVEYGKVRFVFPLIETYPESLKWVKGPDEKTHGPDCKYRSHDWNDPFWCDCRGHIGRKKEKP